MKKLVLLLAVLLFSGSLQAKEIVVEAQGVGDDYDWAIMNAIENAVRQTSEVLVHRDAPMEKYEMKSEGSDSYNESANIKTDDGSFLGGKGMLDLKAEGQQKGGLKGTFENKTIDAHYAGKVDSYKVLSSEQKDGKYYVKISAMVIKSDDYKSPKLVKKADYSLSVQPFKVKTSTGCVNAQNAVNKLQTALIERISKTKRFNLVSRIDLGDYFDEVGLEALNLTKPEHQNKIQNIKSADYLLVGSIDYLSLSTKTTDVEMTGESYSRSSGKLQIVYRLIETATMEIVDSGMAEATYKNESGKMNCSKVASRLFFDASNDIVDQLLKNVFPDYQPVFKKAAKDYDQEQKAKHKSKAAKQPSPKKRQVVKLPFDK